MKEDVSALSDVASGAKFICVLHHLFVDCRCSGNIKSLWQHPPASTVCSHYLRDDLTARSFTYTAENLMEDQDKIHLLRFRKTSTHTYTTQDNSHHEIGLKNTF